MILPCADYSSSSLQNLIHARIPIGVIKSIFPIFCVKERRISLSFPNWGNPVPTKMAPISFSPSRSIPSEKNTTHNAKKLPVIPDSVQIPEETLLFPVPS